MSPALAGGFFTTETPGKPTVWLLKWLSAWTRHLSTKLSVLETSPWLHTLRVALCGTIIFTYSRQERMLSSYDTYCLIFLIVALDTSSAFKAEK